MKFAYHQKVTRKEIVSTSATVITRVLHQQMSIYLYSDGGAARDNEEATSSRERAFSASRDLFRWARGRRIERREAPTYGSNLLLE